MSFRSSSRSSLFWLLYPLAAVTFVAAGCWPLIETPASDTNVTQATNAVLTASATLLPTVVDGATVPAAELAPTGGANSPSVAPLPETVVAPDTPTVQQTFAVLVFSKTLGFRHDSIPAGITMIQQLGERYNFQVDTTEDSTRFTDEGLLPYQVVVFLNTTGDVLDETQQTVFERFIQRGGGYVGIHAASDTEYDWPWYGQLVGAYFASHPAIQTATLRPVIRDHRSTQGLPAEWERTDEWYNFRELPPPEIAVLIQLDETTYEGGTMGADHPISWYHTFDGGRAWYTAMGHTIESYSEPLFQNHVAGGILWAAETNEPPLPRNRVVLPTVTH